MTLLLKVVRYNEIFATTCGIFANVILMILVFTVNKANMKQISRTLLQNSILDLLLSVTILIVEPQIAIINKVYYLIIGSPFHSLGYTFAGFANPFFAFSLVLSILAMPVPFYIRYTVLCKNVVVKLKNLIIIYVVILLYSTGVYMGIILLYPPWKETFEPYKAPLMTTFWLEEYPKGPVFIAEPLKDGHLLMLFGIILFANLISYGLVTAFAIIIAKTLKQNRFQLSARTMALNKQLQKTLIIQTIGPFLTGNLPISIIIAIIFLNIDSPPTTLIAGSVISWVAVINPTAAILIIKPYRQRIIKLIKFKGTQVSSTYSAPQQHNLDAKFLATVTKI